MSGFQVRDASCSDILHLFAGVLTERCFCLVVITDVSILPKQIPQFCAKHKTPAMGDVLSARCVEEGCEKNALYGVRSNKVSTTHTAVVYNSLQCIALEAHTVSLTLCC
jgi:hypothetical protein